jgi:uncharacterized protein YprB with RNaseH-like and TPR domain
MRDSYPALRDRLAQLGVVPRPRFGAGRVADDGGPAFEIRRRVHSTRDIFGRERPHTSDSGAVFLDTETTGLAGGTGTIAFLVGLATVDDGHVTVEQYFLRRPSGEPSMLEALGDRLAEADALVTFNGRRFDWPILEARSIISRMPLQPPADHHDLINVARRLWYRPLGTYRLSVIEREALGIQRGDDIDSSMIPAMYLDYLREGDSGPLEPVFAHNHQDVICLVHLRRRVRRWVEGREDPPSPVDWEGLGVLRLQAADEAGAEEALRRALTVEDDPAVRWRVATRLARVLRRAARWQEMLQLWEREVGGRGAWRVRASIEAAKICHRRLKQIDRATALLEEATGVVEWLLLRGDPTAAVLDRDLSNRLNRLQSARHARARRAR